MGEKFKKSTKSLQITKNATKEERINDKKSAKRKTVKNYKKKATKKDDKKKLPKKIREK